MSVHTLTPTAACLLEFFSVPSTKLFHKQNTFLGHKFAGSSLEHQLRCRCFPLPSVELLSSVSHHWNTYGLCHISFKHGDTGSCSNVTQEGKLVGGRTWWILWATLAPSHSTLFISYLLYQSWVGVSTRTINCGRIPRVPLSVNQV